MREMRERSSQQLPFVLERDVQLARVARADAPLVLVVGF